MTSGIYKITNIANNKFYIGKSIRIETRWLQHKGHLNRNTHINKPLQHAWSKYGKDNFKFEIVEIVDREQLLVIEQKYLNMVFGSKDCYNLHCKSSEGTVGYKHSEETLAKLRGRKCSPEACRKISEARLNCDFKDVYSEMQKGSKNHRARAIIGVNLSTGETVKYSYMREARAAGFEHAAISRVCSGKLQHYKGFVWRYAIEDKN
jgi:group I intron endonuclease